MPTRKRIRTFIPNISGGGGGGPSPGGTINWGPSFGQNPGNDASTWNTSVAVAMPSLALRGGTTANAAVAMPSLGLTGGTTASATLGGSVLGAPFWQSVETAANSAASISITVNKPANVESGDLLLAFVGQSGISVAEISAPVGWKAITQKNVGATVKTAVSFYKVATGSEPASYTFTSSNNSGPFTAEIHHIIAVDDSYKYFEDTSGNNIHGRIWGDVTTTSSPWSGFGNSADCGGAPDDDGLSSGVVSENTVDTIGLSSFVLEAKVRIPSDNFGVLFAMGDTSPDTNVLKNGVIVFLASNDTIQAITYNNGSGTAATSATISYPFEDDVAVVWDGSAVYLLIGGIVEATVALASFPQTDMLVSVGRAPYNPASSASPYPVAAIIDEFRVSFNTDRGYTAGYTPATSPFVTDASTEVLWHMDSIQGTGDGVINAAASTTLNATSLDPDPDTPSVTTTVSNTLVFSWIYHDHLALTQNHSPPAGHVETTDFESTVSATRNSSNSAWRVFSSPGATGTAAHNCTETVATDAVMMRVAIAPGSLTIA